jgi:hypothetical protein
MDLEESKDLVRETLRLLPGRPMPVGEIPSIPFYKRGCQDKYLSRDGETQGVCRPAPVMG